MWPGVRVQTHSLTMARGYAPIPIDAPKLPPLTALRTLARVGRFVRPYRRQVVFAAIALVFAAAAVLAIGQGLKFVIDRGFAAGSGAELDRTLAFMLGVVVVMAVATYARFYFVSWLGERVTADLRRAVFDHLLALPPGYFEVTRTGEVISRLTNDTTMLETVIGSSASMAIRNVLLMIGGLVMLALTSAQAHAARAGRRAAGARADHLLRPPRAQARAREPGPRRRRRRLRRRGAARDPHRAGLRPRGRGPRAVRRARRGRVRAPRSRAFASARCWSRR